MFDLQNKLSGICEAEMKKKFGISTTIHFSFSLDKGRGDLTTSAALSLAKQLKQSPQDVAKTIAQALKSVDGVENVSIAGPGFVNVMLAPATLSGELPSTLLVCSPQKNTKKTSPVIIDYSAPNVAKPLGIHHILSTVIGQSLANLYRHLGFDTVSINHLGDWGTQFGKLAVAYERWGTKKVEEHSIDELLALYVKFHDELATDASLETEGRAAFAKLEQGDTTLREFWKSVVGITMRSLDHLYERLHIHFDHTHGESFYEDKMATIVKEGKKKGVFLPGEGGGLIVRFPETDKLPTLIALKADGSTIYLTRDLATARYRIDTWHPQSILYVVDVAQQLYFKQLFATLGQLGWELPHLEHVLFGRMRFADKDMSTRKGNILKLEAALDEALLRAKTIISERGEKIQTDDPDGLAEMMGVGALVYGILSQNRKMDMVFDWKKMLSFEGNSAPYLQYTHARAKSVLRKGGEEHPALTVATSLSPAERRLTKLLLMFGQTLEDARKDHLPHKLTNYLYDVCQAFNAFYNSDDILGASAEQRAFRLGVTSLTARVLKTGAEILTLRVPDRM
ncbi:MAG: arginine--tRNA ligase [Candidatus Peribacteraceae bacterium]|nr:arginine--tRNA ligase [Candidatus Peribacteraceae bacterium]